jgi:Ca-activated chloride channel family protein
MKLEAALTFDKIRHDQDHDAHLVISLTAPVKDGEERPPICVVPVIDVSGSMGGPKLEYAKRSAIKLVDHLRPGDYTGLVVFETHVHVVIKPQKITPEVKEQMKAEIGKLRPMGGTNFAGGMLKAIELVNALDLPMNVIHRIILLTDGQANQGPATKKEDIIKLFEANAGRVTASAFGYGTDVSAELLGDFAREAKGNYAFIRDPDGALTAFGKELGGLISTYGTDLVVELNALAGHEIVSVTSDVDAEEEDVGGEVTIKIPEILAEERRDLVFAVKLKSQKQALPRAVNVFDVKLTYEVISADGKKEQKTGEAKAKAQFVKPGEENPKPNPALDKIVALAEVVRAQIEAEEKANKGDWQGAAAVMHNAAQNVGGRGYAALQAAACQTAGSVSNAVSYNNDQGYLRSMRLGATRGVGVAQYDTRAELLLADAGVQLSTSSQSSTSSSFSGDAGIVQGAGPAAPVDFTQAVVTGQAILNTLGGAIPNIGLGGITVGSGTDLSALVGHQGGTWTATGSVIAQPNPILIAQPPVPQTDNAADSKAQKREKAIEKAAKKLKKSKSSARW